MVGPARAGGAAEPERARSGVTPKRSSLRIALRAPEGLIGHRELGAGPEDDRLGDCLLRDYVERVPNQFPKHPHARLHEVLIGTRAANMSAVDGW